MCHRCTGPSLFQSPTLLNCIGAVITETCHGYCLHNSIIVQFLIYIFCLWISVNLKSVLPNVWQIHNLQLCVRQFIYITHNSSAIYIWRKAIRCKQIKLLMTSTFAGSCIELPQPTICSLAEYVLGCAWSGLRRLSPSGLGSLNVNFSYTETPKEVNSEHHGCTCQQIEPYSYI